mmetsp:Transcript_33110/g.98475  ORF Transcript_33110/g.98475 Transcript_33110/m.98475 type:complete len:348 (-) Transcript_33110:757-1800(-)
MLLQRPPSATSSGAMRAPRGGHGAGAAKQRKPSYAVVRAAKHASTQAPGRSSTPSVAARGRAAAAFPCFCIGYGGSCSSFAADPRTAAAPRRASASGPTGAFPVGRSGRSAPHLQHVGMGMRSSGGSGSRVTRVRSAGGDAGGGEGAASTATTTTVERAESVTLTLDANPLRSSLLLQLLPEGRGQAVVVVGVLEGSEADKVGIVPGQKVVSISDPVRPDEMWPLNDRPSLRFVKDTLAAMRSKRVKVEFSALPLFTAADTVATSSTGTISDDEGASAPRQTAPKTDVQRRIERRQAYMDQVGQRNDSTFLSVAGLLFLGPAIGILAWAYFSGYLDSMYSNSLMNGR